MTQSSIENNIEETNRFYKKRDIEDKPQNDSNFNIFQQSMFSRLKGIGLIQTIFVIISIYYFEACTGQYRFLENRKQEIESLKTQIEFSNDTALIQSKLDLVMQISSQNKGIGFELHSTFKIILGLCILNCMFFFSTIMQFVFLRKVGSRSEFPLMTVLLDLVLLVPSAVLIDFIFTVVFEGINSGIDSKDLIEQKMFFNIGQAQFKEAQFPLMFSVIIVCLIFKMLEFI